MPIVRSNPTGVRGPKDAKRHREKQKEVIRKKLPDIIAQEDIITDRKGRKVKVPIRGIIIPDFRPGKRKHDDEDEGDVGSGGASGIGQGSGGVGDIVDRRKAERSSKDGQQAGDEPGEDYIETEIDIEEIIEMMYEDLGLPNLQEKDHAELEVSLGFKIRGTKRSGPQVLLDKNRSSDEAIGRFYAYLEILKAETGRDELTCFSALKETGGDLTAAFELLKDLEFKASAEQVEPFPVFENEDLRFFDLREDMQKESNAVIIIELDVSGSMSTDKKYIARSMAFWLTEFLRKIYDKVEVRFIIYHSTARLVDEYTAFHTVESGGTEAHEAHEQVMHLIESQYPTNRWNVYVFQFSDGWDFSPKKAVEAVRKLIDKYRINMFGYGEIRVDELSQSFSNLYEEFYSNMSLRESFGTGKLEVIAGLQDYPFVGLKITEKTQIWPALQEFLKKGRWQR
ncbi:MAG: hypothetical protein A3F94_01740 [Candidatus Spechtbacteria bacterium RIFCSPLOWO2_12_FULL_38_22]|uniref:Sporulation protein YhbH n=1 Tax=Candidatus Spechtbacteria bacterium RIFCSPLOWO2_12_FULL_38_22 TaxID=1802165 RepID=A0A1G2HJ23_9BACT|nr:MAG: hypothetical protein A2728_01245 [Candidatus Spechtbacteria bacterium RIFCSPHIGHO2_01_FULL_38_11]OGZ60290.1 MAG: hypothetical protein A3E58_01265 [Candidatus Spechtbacteria bacterium RIFCSPHIGHO2_12_FULL_38_30]OGZ60709.1 MAG: hypothetical protein A3A00_01635 [Candidatus Spechtbacteria bacterium RIFCSPLOWO2_01_FULL_38_20]OGZ62485.1 MAG: hypothetical protein A3F94_01740 [Candidatus Spechtbacteria bacterium RIFCSPLOWO2_12_FULL_38_22]